MTDHKQVRSVEVKSEDQGEVRAVVATTGVVDKDGDILAPGSFGAQSAVVSPFGHSSWLDSSLPVGRGRITESGNKAVFDGRFFLDTAHGRDAFTTVKELGDLAQWSFGYDVREAREPNEDERRQGASRVLRDLDVHEVSPVLQGAGVDTGTVAAKAGTATVDPDEIEAARERARKADIRRRIMETRQPPGADTRKLGRFAVRIGYKLIGYPGQPWKREAPGLEWFRPSKHPETAGFMRRGEHAIHLARDLQGRELVRTVLHETAHVGQDDPAAKGMEESADSFARRWGAAVEAAHRATGGDPLRVYVKDGRPPWYPPGLDSGDVVLSRAQAYQFNPRNSGDSWTRLYHD